MKIYSIVILIFSFCSLGAEVDNFTDRQEPLEDATTILNRAANGFLDQAVTSANKRGTCNKQRLYRQIKLRFRDRYEDKFARFVHTSAEVPRRVTKIKDSIYADFSVTDSIIMGGLGMIYDSNAPVVNIGNIQIGGDKFEHFFGMGFFYFRRYYLRQESIEKVLDFGMGTETGFLGRYMTGVISYADLAANFKGMHFWNHLLHEGADLLTFERPMGPYIACGQGRWKRIRDVDLSLYVDNGWDEAINCSLFSAQDLLQNVLNRLRRLSQQSDQSMICPVSSETFGHLEKMYGRFGRQILNHRGLGVLRRQDLVQN